MAARDYPNARKAMQRADELYPGSSDGLQNRALLEAYAGNGAEAARLAHLSVPVHHSDSGGRPLPPEAVLSAGRTRLAAALQRLFGSAAITKTDNVIAAHTGHGVILLAPPEDAALMHPLAEVPEGPFQPRLIAMTVTVADPDRAAAFLRLQGVPFRRDPSGAVLVPSGEAHGVALELAHG